MRDRVRGSVSIIVGRRWSVSRWRVCAALALAAALNSGTARRGAAQPAAHQAAAHAAAEHPLAGSVRAGDESRLFGAHVSMIAAATPAIRTEATTDLDGAFEFAGVPDGDVMLTVRRLGFRPETLTVQVPQPPGGPVVVMLARVAQPLAAVLVHDRSRVQRSAFERRRTGGFGHFVTRDDIDRARPQHTSDLFRPIPGVSLSTNAAGLLVPYFRAAGRADRCEPAYWLDGSPLGNGTPDLDALDPRSLEGIEVYLGNATIPSALHQTSLAGGCGVIALWTRHGDAHADDVADPGVSDSLDAMVARGAAFTADQVELAAMPLPGFGPTPAYPDSLRAANVRGHVVAEFVVDRQGRVIPDAIGIVSSTHPLFAAAVRAGLLDARFSPAYRDGHVVRQVVHLPVDFDPTARTAAAATERPPR